MTLLLALALLAQDPPVVEFPQPGLDDPAAPAYEGYTTRIYRDAAGNAVQIYLDRTSGRVVHLWADALNESIGFTARDAAGRPAALEWGPPEGAVAVAGATRALETRLTSHTSPLILGHALLGSMRIERDFQYSRGHLAPFDAPPFVPEELSAFVAALTPDLARRLGALNVAELRARLHARAAWRAGRVVFEQRSLDGKHRLWLELVITGGRTSIPRGGRTVRITATRRGRPITLRVRVRTDGPPLTPLPRRAIFNAAFLRFAAAAPDPRIERQIRGFELLSSREKLMAGLPNFATYFGRDMLMTALLMEPVWSDTMAEHVIAAALRKLSSTGEVSHEEALGGQAIRETAAEYVKTRDAGLLANLAAPRENYMMVDDDFQLAVVAARYLANPRVPRARKRAFVRRWREPLLRNLAFAARSAAPYAAQPVATNLVSFRRLDDGWWHAGSWRDSRVGYAGGRFAFDVNVVWVPAALRAIGVIDRALRALGSGGVPEAQAAREALQQWRGAGRHFAVALAPAEAEARVRARLAALPAAERAHWERVVARTGFPADTLRFPAIALDSAGAPIPVMSTDPAMWLLLDDLGPARQAELLRPFTLPYPVGLLVDGVGPVAANDAYAPPAVWAMFERDRYHSPRVVWGREVNVLLAALARGEHRSTLEAISAAVERSGLHHAELWSYRVEGDSLRAVRYGTSSDVQLWNLTDLAVRFLLARTSPRGP